MQKYVKSFEHAVRPNATPNWSIVALKHVSYGFFSFLFFYLGGGGDKEEMLICEM